MNIYDHTVRDIEGKDVSMKEFEGKVLLIVNTATGCGFTPQYQGLENLYEKYRNQGFEILDFPSNQFLNQAPGTDQEISNFCSLNYGVKFPQFSKIDVNGPQEAPLFTFLKEQRGGVLGRKIKWNFTKFLVDRNGRVVVRFAPTVTPEQIESKISALL